MRLHEDKCNGCRICATACHEGAIEIIDGKAKLVRENFCDGFGDCLPGCPTGAITFEEREAPAYDEAAVLNAKQKKMKKESLRLSNWPVQIKLAPTKAPYFDDSDLLIAADCTAYAYANLFSEFINGRIVLIGCPKLDGINYSDNLTEIIKNNDVKSVTIIRMEVPCCGGLEMAAKRALADSQKYIPSQVITISIDGQIMI
ncbi:MAG: ATP-binding protein [Lachnospiraceae bacterium]